MKVKIFKFKKVTSTNDVAINLIKKNNQKVGCVYADEQSKGRGTYGKKWISSKGNLFTSLFFPIKKNIPHFKDFIIINSLIVSDILKNIYNIKGVKIKLPNDILIKKKKICGILQEIITFKKKKFIIIGIGLNIHSSPIFKKYKTTNIFKETKKKVKIEKIIKLIISSYQNFFLDLNLSKYNRYKKKASLLLSK
jgi:BirA family transcriptional regulator, biotin operon repressor / biotin---[acetyl-CoA-carboxylase] ligase